MKRWMMCTVAVLLATAGLLAAQEQPNPQSNPPAAPPSAQPAAPAPGAQPAPAPPAAPAPAPAPAQSPAPQAAPAPPAPAPPHQPEAKTQAEYDAYQKAAAETDLAAAEAAAKDFEARFPASELRGVLYQHLMNRYQEANNAPKTIEMGRKVLQYFPDDSVALVTTANVLAEATLDTDPDHDARFAEAEQDARHAIDTIATGLSAPPSWTPPQVEAARNLVLSMAHAAIGFVELRKNNNPLAEQELRRATQLDQSQPYAPTWYRLALALDHEGKYKEALDAVNQSIPMFGPNDPMVELAKREQDRLNKLTGTPAPPVPPPPANPGSTPPATPPPAPK